MTELLKVITVDESIDDDNDKKTWSWFFIFNFGIIIITDPGNSSKRNWIKLANGDYSIIVGSWGFIENEKEIITKMYITKKNIDMVIIKNDLFLIQFPLSQLKNKLLEAIDIATKLDLLFIDNDNYFNI